MSGREDRIRRRAYEIWEREGRPAGREEEHWHKAAREVEAEDAAGSAPGASEMPRRGRAASGARKPKDQRSGTPPEPEDAAARGPKASTAKTGASDVSEVQPMKKVAASRRKPTDQASATPPKPKEAAARSPKATSESIAKAVASTRRRTSKQTGG